MWAYAKREKNAMRSSSKLGLLSTVSFAALAIAGGPASAASTTCNGTMTGQIAGNVVVPVGGSCTLYQANVAGNVQVSQNGTCW